MQLIHAEWFRQRLEEQLARTEATIADLRMDLDQSLSASISEFSTYDNHPADVASETYERAKDLGLQGDQEHIRDQIEAALQRIAEGTYGWCAACGKPIAEARLKAIPYVARCLDCQDQEMADVPQIDRDELVSDIYRNSFTDGATNENVAFDGEDTWQAVARYGTSNTPGDFRQVESYDDVYIDHDESVGSVYKEDTLPVSFERSRRKFMKRGR